MGEWLGFPLVHSADPLPEWLLRGAAAITPWVSPAQSAILPRIGGRRFPARRTGCDSGLLSTRHRRCARGVRARRSGSLATGSSRRRCTSAAGVLQGSAVHFLCNLVLRRRAVGRRDFRWKLAARTADRKRARVARCAAGHEAWPSQAWDPDHASSPQTDGVLIRNINLQDLIAVSYGVSHFSVTTNQMYSADAKPELNAWMLTPYYDVRISASIREPERIRSVCAAPACDQAAGRTLRSRDSRQRPMPAALRPLGHAA